MDENSQSPAQTGSGPPSQGSNYSGQQMPHTMPVKNPGSQGSDSPAPSTGNMNSPAGQNMPSSDPQQG